MAQYTPNDPMAKPVLVGGLVLIGLAVYVLVSSLVHTIERNSMKGELDTNIQSSAADIILAPIGSVTTVDKSIVKAARTGEAVFTAVCTSCHSAGVLGAPKIDDKAAWTPRVQQGLDVLVNHAVNGIRSMPARGGDPTLSDEEITNAIVYMTGKAGHDLSAQVKKADGAAPAAAAAPAEQAAAPAAAPAEQAAAPAAAAPAAAAPAEQAAAPAAAAPAEQAAAPAAAAPAEQAAAPAAAAPAAGVDGEKVYKSVCFACHDSGVAGSPKLGDKAAWGPRIATGKDALHNSALHGKNAMPAKGGNPALSDDEVKAAVDFMMSQAQ